MFDLLSTDIKINCRCKSSEK